MPQFSNRVRREADGSIDYAYSRRRALRLRRARIRYMLRRRVVYRHALYAGAVLVGLIVGVTLPLAPPECRNCETSLVDVPPGAEIDLLGATMLVRHDTARAQARW